MFTTIALIILTATAAVFAVLYFTNRSEAAKYESRSESLSSELNGIREELARVQASNDNRMMALKSDAILEFLKNTEGLDAEYVEGSEIITFMVDDERYHIDTRRLPLQVILRKGYNLDGIDVNWDIMKRASLDVTDELIMIKMNVSQDNNTLDYYIVSPDRSLDNFAKNFEFYMSLIRDAEGRFSQRCHEYEEAIKASGLGNSIPSEYIQQQCESQKMKS